MAALARRIRTKPPFPTGPDALFVAYYASAELGCFRALGWPMPANVLDLFAEFRDRTNGLTRPPAPAWSAPWLISGSTPSARPRRTTCALLILRGGPWSENEREAILDYCATDIDALERLLPAMLPRIDLPRALLRGRYMAAAAAMEWNGVPIDMPTLELLREHWTDIQDDLIAAIDADYGVYDGRSFQGRRWSDSLSRTAFHGRGSRAAGSISATTRSARWPRRYPIVSPLRELRSALSDLRLNDLAVGRDGRNRTILSAFRLAHRPQSTKQHDVHIRPERLAARVDQATARLRRCLRRLGATGIRDRRRAIGRSRRCKRPTGPATLTWHLASRPARSRQTRPKQTHGPVRELSRHACSASSTAWRPRSWRCGSASRRSSRATCCARTTKPIDVLALVGRRRRSRHAPRVPAHRIRLARARRREPEPAVLAKFSYAGQRRRDAAPGCCLATERGIEVCAPVHDAFLICAPLDRLEDDVARMREAMAEASRIVLDGFEIRTDATIVRYPDRYMDPRGAVMWDRVTRPDRQASAGG